MNPTISLKTSKFMYNGIKKAGKSCVDKVQNSSADCLSISKSAKVMKEECINFFKRISQAHKKQSTCKDIAETLPLIKDETIINYINSQLKTGEKPSFIKLKEIKTLIDSVNTANGHYSVINTGFKKSNIKTVVDYFKKTGKTEQLRQPLIEKEIAIEEKFFSMKEFIKNNPKHEMSDYLYKNYYIKFLKEESAKQDIKIESYYQRYPIKKKVKSILPEIIDTLEQINDKFGTKVFLDSSIGFTKQADCKKATDFIYNELSDWNKVSNGKANLGRVLDLSKIKKDFIENEAAGFYNKHGNSISIDSIDNVEYALRHELIHANEEFGQNIFWTYIDTFNELLHKILPDRTNKPINILDKIRNINEFKKGGISTEHARYGFTNSSEYIAVAGEGDTRKYSKPFRTLLYLLGFPKYAFNLKPPTIKHDESIIANYLKKHIGKDIPTVKLDEIKV